MNTPIFSRITTKIRNSTMPEEMRQKLILLFFRMNMGEQIRILSCLETNKDTLPIFAEFLTELEQEGVNLNDTAAIENLFERYIEKLPV